MKAIIMFRQCCFVLALVGVLQGTATADQLALPQRLTSLFSDEVFVENNGFRFSAFEVITLPVDPASDMPMVNALNVSVGQARGYGGLEFSFDGAGIATTPERRNRTATIQFTITTMGRSSISEVRIDLEAKHVGLAAAAAALEIEDITAGHLGTDSLYLSAIVAGPSEMESTATHFPPAATRGVVLGRARLSFTVAAFTTESSATMQKLLFRLTDGQGTSPGDFDLNGCVDGADFLVWQRYIGSTHNLMADGNKDFIVEAADLRIWKDGLPGTHGLLGDYDRDGYVDGTDFLYWQRQLGSAVAAYSGADGDGNGVIDAADFVIWRNNFGASSNSSSLAGVPEPSSLLMCIAGIAVISRLR